MSLRPKVSPDTNNIAVTAKGVNSHCIIHGVKKAHSVHLIENPVVNDRRFLKNAFQKKIFFN